MSRDTREPQQPTVACLGEMLLRLSGPRDGRLFDSPALLAHFGGAEGNVAIALAHLGLSSRFIGAAPDGAMGDAVAEHLMRHGVGVEGLRRAPGRLGLYFLSPGAGVRPSSILYDRADSVFASSTASDFDWPALLCGAQWLHHSGITPALGARSAELGLAAARAARDLGLRISFDGNYRATLWERSGSDPVPTLRDYVAMADLFIGNHRDISLLLGRSFDGDGSDRRREAAEALFDAFPNLRHIASTARQTLNADSYSLSARIDAPDGHYESAAIPLDAVIDRIGTGDAFAAGVIAALDDGLEAAAETGLALAALKHFTLGDASTSTRADVAAFRQGQFDVRR
ncbi:MAG: sugar kinase [Sphingobium sp.]